MVGAIGKVVINFGFVEDIGYEWLGLLALPPAPNASADRREHLNVLT